MAAVRSSRWEDACTAAAILAVDPTGVAGISLRSAAGPVRDRWLAHCMRAFPRQSKWHRIPLNVGDDRLLGGLDLSATLRAGRPVAEQGILSQADGGVITLSMAERLSPGTAAKIGSVLDRHEVLLERDGFTRRSRARFAVIALDEGIDPDERPPDSLLERLALHIDINGLPVSVTDDAGLYEYDIPRARSKLSQVRAADEVFIALCEVSAAFGVSSARAVWLALRVARAITALDDRIEVSEADIALAARLVFAPRAVVAPGDPPQAQEAPPAPQTPDHQSRQTQPPQPVANESQSEAAQQSTPGQAASQDERQQPGGSLGERVLAAAKAALPANFLGQLRPAQARSMVSPKAGRSGGEHISQSRGRPTGTRAGELRPGSRINVIETLRAAAPWQRLRRLAAERAAANRQHGTADSAPLGAGQPSHAVNQPQPPANRLSRAVDQPQHPADTPQRAADAQQFALDAPPSADARHRSAPLIRVIKDDIRVIRFIRRNRSTTIFLVDASGSAALNRLAEVKGAVELMLAESYVRRDRVALISFRGAAAQILLPPTNSLVRAKRELASLPGGGGTPLAIGIDAARNLADSLKRRGESSMVVILTDGRPNITRDGKGNRARAEADAVSAARMMRTNSIVSLMVDTAPQPRSTTELFAREMGARYVPLPYADAGTLATVVSQCGRHAHV